MSNDTKITSEDIAKMLDVSTQWNTEEAQELRKHILQRFDTVMSLIERDAWLKSIMQTYREDPNNAERILASFRRSLLKNIVKGEMSSVTVSDKKDIGELNSDSILLDDLSNALKRQYTGEWYAPEMIDALSKSGTQYLEVFLRYYGWRMSSSQDRDSMSEFDDREDDSQTHDAMIDLDDIVIIKILVSCVQSYLRYFWQKIQLPHTDHAIIHDFYIKEVASGRWKAFKDIMQQMRKILFDGYICDQLDDVEYNYPSIITELVQEWDSYALEMSFIHLREV